MKHILQPVERPCCRAVRGRRAGGIRPRPWHLHSRRRHLRHGDEARTARRQRNRAGQRRRAGTASAGVSIETAGCGPASVAVFGAAPSAGAAAAGISVAFGSAGAIGDVAAVLNAPVGVLAAPVGARSPSIGPFGAAAASGASVGVAPGGTAADEASASLDCSDGGKGCVALSRLALAFRGSGTVALAASWRNVGSFGGPT